MLISATLFVFAAEMIFDIYIYIVLAAIARHSGNFSSNGAGSSTFFIIFAKTRALFFVMEQYSTFLPQFNMVASIAYWPEKAADDVSSSYTATEYSLNEHASDLVIFKVLHLADPLSNKWGC